MVNHGGSRPGAGRKADIPGEKKITISCRVSPSTKDFIRANRINIGKLLEDAIKGMR